MGDVGHAFVSFIIPVIIDHQPGSLSRLDSVGPRIVLGLPRSFSVFTQFGSFRTYNIKRISKHRKLLSGKLEVKCEVRLFRTPIYPQVEYTENQPFSVVGLVNKSEQCHQSNQTFCTRLNIALTRRSAVSKRFEFDDGVRTTALI
ncbi:hypothetical protein AHF37_07108 [Paragonimus kellicotti]|nr:hypothetical protein AHF37_07108 [Paragonimus kellicotti]